MTPDPLIQLEDLTFAYGAAAAAGDPPGRRPVLDGLQLALATGERLGLRGANGSGKTTLLRLIVGLLRPTRGRVVAFGVERRAEADFREVRARVGFVFQNADDQLFCPTVIEDVAFGPLNLGRPPAAALREAEETLARLGLAPLADRVTAHLSGGEKRLVSVAAVLAMNPEVLLLDEPTNDLDETARARLVEVLGALPQAMILVSHDADFLSRLATRRASLRDGAIAEA